MLDQPPLETRYRFLYVVGANGVIQEREAELLRAIADTLDCPMPPFVEAAAG